MHTKSFHADEYLDRDVWYGITHGTLCSEDQLQEFVCSQGFTSMYSVRQVHGSTVVNTHSSCNGDEADAIVS